MSFDDVARESAPAYVFMRGRFDRNVEEFLAAFKREYPNMNAAYSYKTNYASGACVSADRHGCYAEVVSPMEYDYALSLGVRPERIIYNGVYKTPESIRKAASLGSAINANDRDELSIIIQAAKEAGAKPKAGIRLRLDVGAGRPSRFGVDPEGAEFGEMLEMAREAGISISGLQCHISPDRSAESFGRRAALMAEAARRAGGVARLDLGGKMYGRMDKKLSGQFEAYIPSYGEYASAVGKVFREEFPSGGTELVMEPGTALASDCMVLAARVLSVREIGGRGRVAVVDASVRDLGFLGKKRPPIRVIRGGRGGGVGKCMIVGCSCIEDDVICDSYEGEIGVGDTVVVGNAGAYTCNLASRFIKPVPPIVEYDGEEWAENMEKSEN